ncbi:MAG: hypothetical protein IPJ06_20025 [Saprospiraceae bacterium]|nr:hypothetical protein [Saprospiraceae bacterium]
MCRGSTSSIAGSTSTCCRIPIQFIPFGRAANVALNVREMGAEPVLVAVVGADAEAVELERLVEEAGLSDHSFLIREEGRRTTIKPGSCRQPASLAGGRRRHTSRQRGQCPAVDGKLEVELQRERVDVIILQDYDKGVLSPDMIQSVITLAKQFEILVTVDPKFRHFLQYSSTLFKPNLKELSEGLARRSHRYKQTLNWP